MEILAEPSAEVLGRAAKETLGPVIEGETAFFERELLVVHSDEKVRVEEEWRETVVKEIFAIFFLLLHRVEVDWNVRCKQSELRLRNNMGVRNYIETIIDNPRLWVLT